MKIKLVLLFFICFNHLSFSQNSYDSEFIAKLKSDVMKGQKDKYEQWKAFEGKLGKDKRVFFLLNTYIYNPKKTKIWGEYLYTKYNTPIQLEGILKGSKVYLKEFVKGKHTGTLIFDMENSTGEWTNNQGSTYTIEIELCELRAYVQQYYSNRLEDIQNKNFKAFVKGYKTSIIPNFAAISDSDEKRTQKIDRKIAAQYLKKSGYENFDDDQAGYLYGDAFFTEHHIYLFTIEYYSPRAFGIDDQLLLVHIFDYKGNLKSSKNLGCNCNDSDMGIEAEHSRSASILVDWDKITIFKKGNSIYFEQDKEINQSWIDYYKISPTGELIEQ